MVRDLVSGLVTELVSDLVGGDSAGGSITPAIVAASVAADGVTWTLQFNKPLFQGAAFNVADFSGNGSVTGAVTFTYVSGSGSAFWTLTGSPAMIDTDVVDLDWAGTANGIEDADGTDLAAFSNFPVTNNVVGTNNFIFEDGNNFIFEDGNNFIFES